MIWILRLDCFGELPQWFWWPCCNRQSRPLFLDKVANKILAFEEGGVREFFGNYTDYLDEKAFLQEQSALLEKEKEQARVKVEKVKEDKRRMSYFEKQEWAIIEDEITDLESKIEEIEAAMLENASDYGQLASLQRDLDTTNETLLEKYERYEYLRWG